MNIENDKVHQKRKTKLDIYKLGELGEHHQGSLLDSSKKRSFPDHVHDEVHHDEVKEKGGSADSYWEV